MTNSQDFRAVSFKYDPFGRRIFKSSSSGTSIYAYDGDNLVEETNSSGAAIARYEDTQNIDEPLAMLRSRFHCHKNVIPIAVNSGKIRTKGE